MTAIDDLLAASERFAAGVEPGGARPARPARGVAIVTCMDARIQPARIFGLEEGDAHVIRNAGGSAKEALRSLMLSQRLLGTKAVMVVKHTNCGMHGLDPRRAGPGAESLDLLAFDDLHQAVRDDLALLRASPLIADDAEIRGFVYDVRTRRLAEVALT